MQEAREREDMRSEQDELEVAATHLYRALSGHVPLGLALGREGSRVYLVDVESTEEATVSSLAEASRFIGDWTERHTGH